MRVPGRRAAVIERLGHNELVGWSWLLPPHAWQTGAEATTPVRAYEFDAVAARSMCRDDPALGNDISQWVGRVLAHRLCSAGERRRSAEPVGDRTGERHAAQQGAPLSDLCPGGREALARPLRRTSPSSGRGCTRRGPGRVCWTCTPRTAPAAPSDPARNEARGSGHARHPAHRLRCHDPHGRRGRSQGDFQGDRAAHAGLEGQRPARRRGRGPGRRRRLRGGPPAQGGVPRQRPRPVHPAAPPVRSGEGGRGDRRGTRWTDGSERCLSRSRPAGVHPPAGQGAGRPGGVHPAGATRGPPGRLRPRHR